MIDITAIVYKQSEPRPKKSTITEFITTDFISYFQQCHNDIRLMSFIGFESAVHGLFSIV